VYIEGFSHEVDRFMMLFKKLIDNLRNTFIFIFIYLINFDSSKSIFFQGNKIQRESMP
jgi:hypothetical protein